MWSASLNAPATTIAALSGCMSVDECARAARFHFERERRRFTVSRALLRIVLSSYRRCEPRLLRFRYGPRGKPALDSAQHDAPLDFNLAHSQDLVLIAVAEGRTLGVDVEFIRPIDDLEGMAEQVCSLAELRQLGEMPQAQRHEMFLRCWTRKEACVKALGEGLSFPLRCLHVGCEPGDPGVARIVDADASEPSFWSLYDLAPAPGCLGALATRDRACRITSFSVDVEGLVADAVGIAHDTDAPCP